MKYRRFGNTGLLVSEIGFGAWAIGGDAMVGNVPIGWGNADDQESEAALNAALEVGINFFDTADFYGLGHSEDLIGKVISTRKDAMIATKVGHRDIDGKIILDYSSKYIKAACEKSLKRLRREAIDYYQLHSARIEHLKQGECIDAMQQLKKEGKVRYWGVSLNTFHPEPEADFLIKNNYGDGLQLVFNLINQRAHHIMKSASRAGFGVIARMPLQFGLLTGKFDNGVKFQTGDHRSFRLTPEVIEKSRQLLQAKVWPKADELNLSKTAMAMSYILSHQEVSVVIPGIRNVTQVQENTADLRVLNSGLTNELDDLKGEWSSVVEMMEKLG
jgi:aryl-alcohol dehydrogenase-like predicted oxidoreductase